MLLLLVLLTDFYILVNSICVTTVNICTVNFFRKLKNITIELLINQSVHLCDNIKKFIFPLYESSICTCRFTFWTTITIISDCLSILFFRNFRYVITFLTIRNTHRCTFVNVINGSFNTYSHVWCKCNNTKNVRELRIICANTMLLMPRNFDCDNQFIRYHQLL